MSQKGIKAAASLFSQMQQLRIDLLAGDKQDILIGQMIEKGKDAMKGDFMRATSDPAIDETASADKARRDARIPTRRFDRPLRADGGV
jgi:hypothetical protein